MQRIEKTLGATVAEVRRQLSRLESAYEARADGADALTFYGRGSPDPTDGLGPATGPATVASPEACPTSAAPPVDCQDPHSALLPIARVAWRSGAVRRIALLEIPTTHLQIDPTGNDAAAYRVFMSVLERAIQRGGG